MKLSDLPKLKPLIEAYERGETIQIRIDGRWEDYACSRIEFSCDISDYRIKPKPREFLIAVDSLGKPHPPAYADCAEYKLIKVREVV